MNVCGERTNSTSKREGVVYIEEDELLKRPVGKYWGDHSKRGDECVPSLILGDAKLGRCGRRGQWKDWTLDREGLSSLRRRVPKH